ncbi:hypothetical protein C0992_010453 [Termitomyces sp. T32_za158]|nr:hypothetical protein C0992_010453 [Termitomyces sp. T32_za158]
MRSNSPGASVSFPFTVPTDGEVQNTILPLFSVSGLSGANHTLKLLLIKNDSAPTDLSIDYLTFVSSSSSSGTKPITNTSPTASIDQVLIFSTPTNSPSSIKPSGARLAGLIFGVIGIAVFVALLIFRRRIFRRRVRPPPETRPFALAGHRKDAAVEQTPPQQEQRLPPDTTGRPLRGILKKESESRPVLEVNALPPEANPPVTGKAIKIDSPILPARKESSTQPLSGPNYPWFSSQQLTNGNHVLKIDLSGNTSGAHFSLEYITFAASSENLDTNTHQVPPSVFIGIGAGVGVLVIGILLILWWWYRRRSRRSQSDSAATSVETSVLPDPAYQGAKRGRMNQRVEKSTLQACSARILTPYFPAVSESTRQNEVSTSVKTQYNRSTQVQRLSDSEERRIKQPRRKEDAWQYSKTPTNVLNLPTKPSSSRLPYVSVQSPRATAPYHLARNPQHLNKPKTDRPQHVASATSEGTGTSPIGHLPEGAWGMRMQQLEELIWELRGETAPLELGQDQVGTGHSTTLTAMMEEISEHRKSVEKNQFRGEERYSVPHGNAV